MKSDKNKNSLAGVSSAVPTQMTELIDSLICIIGGNPLALASVTAVALCILYSKPQLIDQGVKVPHEDVVHVICPLHVVRESYYFLVA